MDVSMLIGAMAFTTLLSVAGFAYYSKIKVDEQMEDPKARKSTLAKDQDPHARLRMCEASRGMQKGPRGSSGLSRY